MGDNVSSRRPAQALGLTGIDKSNVSRACREQDELVEGLRNRPLEGEYPYLWLDMVCLKVRQNHRVISQAMVIAIGVRNGREGNPGFFVGCEHAPFGWIFCVV